MVEYEYRELTIPPWMGTNETRRMLTDEAEYGQWELARVRYSFNGRRRVWLRRKIIRVPRRSAASSGC
ncbi:DUF5703 family protein [Gephyromycinifex aptenodytis]|uniref:DUF5703 family protein n=1 Tax=Gephyromycinifex aptenodytis TaxID=2716227 RepID=UPI001446B0CC|nr:DUF5703 family protein [Gephyromycinifex aptenodytis]